MMAELPCEAAHLGAGFRSIFLCRRGPLHAATSARSRKFVACPNRPTNCPPRRSKSSCRLATCAWLWRRTGHPQAEKRGPSMAAIPGCSIGVARVDGSRRWRRGRLVAETASSSPAGSSTAAAAFACGSNWVEPKHWTRPFWKTPHRPPSPAPRWATTTAARARLVFSEADGLSGLVVDRYAQWLSVQVTAWATAARLDELVSAAGQS